MSQEISEIYNNILKGYKYVKTLIIYKKVTIPDFKKQPLEENDSFPREIQTYIKSNMKEMITYKININGKNIVLNFYTDKHSSIPDNKSLYKTFIIIYVLSLYSSKKCSRHLTIDIFLTPFRRMLPKKADDIIGPMNINGGYTYGGCRNTNEITIYREEEWFKVLIHELFHNLDLDFSTMDIDRWREKMLDIFGIESEYNIYETYCETWARILNVAIVSFMNSINSINSTNINKKEFLSKFNLLIKKEQIFSLVQSNKILKIIKRQENYRETTNVLCYYVLTAALINNYSEFLKWCATNNYKLLKFRHTYKNVNSFLNLILKEYNSQQFIKNLTHVDKMKKDRSLRMTSAFTI